MRPPIDIRLSAEVNGRTVDFGSLLRRSAVSAAYRLRVRRGHLMEVELRRADGRPMDVERLRFTFTFPLLNFTQVVVPDCGRFFVDKLRSVYLRSSVLQMSAPNDGMPLMVMLGQDGAVEFAFGFASNLTETTFRCRAPKISSRGALLGGEDLLVLEAEKPSVGWRCGRNDCVRESIFLCGRRPSWFHALRDYSRLVRRKLALAYPRCKEAWEPAWCTWTAWPSDEMNEQKVLANAREAKRLGIGTVIIDDGWFGQGLDVDGGRLNLGDIEPDPGKFPDLRGLVERLHAMGLKVLLWYAPLSISPESNACGELKGLLVGDRREAFLTPNGFHNLCPQNPDARAHVAEQIRRMVREHDVDGFKTDLYNCLPTKPCTAAHEHDCESAIEGMRRVLRVVWETLQVERPGGLLELKQNYGNAVCAQFGTMVRAGDTAYDVDTNMLRCLHTQAYAHVVHNDYLAWGVHERPRDLAVMLIKQLVGGVPTFSRDLPSLPASHLRVLKAWLGFYRRHLGIFKGARQPQCSNLSTWQIGAGRQVILGVVSPPAELRLGGSVREAFVMNGSGCTGLLLRAPAGARFSVSTYDCCLKARRTERRAAGDGTMLQVPTGGMAALRRL